MAKRFTDSEKWRDPWFKRLKGKYQLFWLFCLDTCDHAGIWKDQIDDFTYLTSMEISWSEIAEHFKDRIYKVKEDTYFIPKFVIFQYPNFNPDKNNAHLGVNRSLKYSGVLFDPSQKEGLPRGCLAPQDKEQEQVKDMDKEQEKESVYTAQKHEFSDAERQEFINSINILKGDGV